MILNALTNINKAKLIVKCYSKNTYIGLCNRVLKEISELMLAIAALEDLITKNHQAS